MCVMGTIRGTRKRHMQACSFYDGVNPATLDTALQTIVYIRAQALMCQLMRAIGVSCVLLRFQPRGGPDDGCKLLMGSPVTGLCSKGSGLRAPRQWCKIGRYQCIRVNPYTLVLAVGTSTKRLLRSHGVHLRQSGGGFACLTCLTNLRQDAFLCHWRARCSFQGIP